MAIEVTQDETGEVWVRAQIQLERTRDTAIVPTYAHGPSLDNGVDLYAAVSVVVPAGKTAVVPLGWKVKLPKGYGLFVLPRSGLSFKTPLRVANGPGLIDHGFREEAGVIVWNTDEQSLVEVVPGQKSRLGEIFIPAGQRIAQAVLLHTPVMCFEVVESLDATERGEGFGSSDK